MASIGSANYSFAETELRLQPTPPNHAIMYESLRITVTEGDPAGVTARVTDVANGNSVDLILNDDGGGVFSAGIAINNPALIDSPETLPHPFVLANINTSDDGILRVEILGTAILPQEITVEIAGIATPTGTRQPISLVIDCGPNNDDDEDFICDDWETGDFLIITGDHDNNPATPDETYQYDCVGDLDTEVHSQCTKNTKDIFVEIDWMQGHHPDMRAIEEVVDAFAKAPIDCNPSGKNCKGINLHIQIDSNHAILHDQDIPFPGYEFESMPLYKGFDQLKGNQFGTFGERGTEIWDKDHPERILKHQVFRYGFFNHERLWNGGESGVSEINGNDFMISLASYTGMVGSLDQQSGTLMHELGHTLGLNHGGESSDDINNKPNYFSVMTYSRQFADHDPNRSLDYSSAVLGHSHTNGELVEFDLIEGDANDTDPDLWGLEPHPDPTNTERVIFSCPWGEMHPLYYGAGDDINWDCDTEWDGTTPVWVDINNLPVDRSEGDREELSGYDDWSNLHFNFTEYSDYVDGVHINEDMGIASGDLERGHPPGIPPGETPASVERVSAGIVPPVNIPDPGFRYKSMVKELTIQDVTNARISYLLGYLGQVNRIPSTEFFGILPVSYEESADSSKITIIQLGPETPSPTPVEFLMPAPSEVGTLVNFKNKLTELTDKQIPENLDTKGVFIWGIEQAIDEINHHDIEKTKQIVQLIDIGLKVALDESYYNYEMVQLSLIAPNLIQSYDKALDFTMTDIHNVDHQPTGSGIIPENEIKTRTNDTKIATNPPPILVECTELLDVMFNENCGQLWWIPVLIVIIIAIVIYIWRRI